VAQAEQAYKSTRGQAEKTFKDSEIKAQNAYDEGVRQALKTCEEALVQVEERRAVTVEQAWNVYTKSTG